MSATLTALPALSEPIADRIRRLQNEARTMASDHVDQLRCALVNVSILAGEIAEGGEAYPVGAREMARRLVEEASHQANTLGAITDRAR